MNCTGTPKFEDLLSFTISDLKRLGLLAPDATRRGSLSWKSPGGREIASITVVTDTAAIPFIRFQYSRDGSPVDYSTPLRFVPSNLNRGGYFLFICPVTGRLCRKLYLIGGRFVSRYAFRGVYEIQTRSRSARSGVLGYITAVRDANAVINSRYRKKTYRGNPTPYGRKCEKIAARLRTLNDATAADAEKSLTRAAKWAENPGR